MGATLILALGGKCWKYATIDNYNTYVKECALIHIY